MKRTTYEHIDEIVLELAEMAEREAHYLWRLARKAKAHGVSDKTVARIREEADILYRTVRDEPDRMLAWDFRYNMKYAFH